MVKREPRGWIGGRGCVARQNTPAFQPQGLTEGSDRVAPWVTRQGIIATLTDPHPLWGSGGVACRSLRHRCRRSRDEGCDEAGTLLARFTWDADLSLVRFDGVRKPSGAALGVRAVVVLPSDHDAPQGPATPFLTLSPPPLLIIYFARANLPWLPSPP